MTAPRDLTPATSPLRMLRSNDPLEQAKAMRAASLLQNRWGPAAYAVMLLTVGPLDGDAFGTPEHLCKPHHEAGFVSRAALCLAHEEVICRLMSCHPFSCWPVQEK